ncbi:hypothetical protein OAT00_03690, partial [Pelagibacteraceae bacterium]|nr:hypothetical protein [Pelagibacteraceae bacterium]
KKKFKNFKTVAGFHTRNVPHLGHEWIHRYALNSCEALFIQPLVGQYKNREYKDSVIIKTNKFLSKKNSKIFFSTLNSYPRYAGPREAILHAIIRKNFGCTHFIVGRDHAGYKNFYDKYASQKLCKKFEKKIKIIILKLNSPGICKDCKIIASRVCSNCKSVKLQDISGTQIRNFLCQNKSIPEYLMRRSISKSLNKFSLIS